MTNAVRKLSMSLMFLISSQAFSADLLCQGTHYDFTSDPEVYTEYRIDASIVGIGSAAVKANEALTGIKHSPSMGASVAVLPLASFVAGQKGVRLDRENTDHGMIDKLWVGKDWAFAEINERDVQHSLNTGEIFFISVNTAASGKKTLLSPDAITQLACVVF